MRTPGKKIFFKEKRRDRNLHHKAKLLATGQTQCHYCEIECGNDITADHKQPLSRGGRDDMSNIVPACYPCNQRKGDALYIDFMELITLEKLLAGA